MESSEIATSDTPTADDHCQIGSLSALVGELIKTKRNNKKIKKCLLYTNTTPLTLVPKQWGGLLQCA